jgi:alpha,alpha-trehalase
MTTCSSIVDPKIASAAVLYIPQGFAEPESLRALRDQCRVEVKSLPFAVKPGMDEVKNIGTPGLLFLQNKYVVPGGRFNEMYGWDSYFIILGLLRDGRVDLAKGMVDNFLFEIEHYGTVLNANRTYFLTRSQPPFLTSMILAVYHAQKAAGHEDRDWLRKAYSFASEDYEMWTREPHLAGDTGLSRYYDFGNGPVAEGLQDETGYYRTVATYFISHPQDADHDLVESKVGETPSDAIGFPFSLQVCESTPSGNKCDPFKTLFLSRDFYKGDRSMRESGFDISFRFGPYGAHTQDYAPVCLNSLLYKTEKDLEEIAGMLGEKNGAAQWNKRAEDRKARVSRYLWDAEKGLFFDYDFTTGKRSTYEYVTTFYPLWAGLASPEQARAVEKNLPIFEQPGGLVMSRTDSGAQWDYPYGWAPTQLLGIEGLRRYQFTDDANRLSHKFLSMVDENFRRDGTIREKYNVVTRSSETHVTAGYTTNVVGFGWTNGVFLQLLHELPQAESPGDHAGAP